MFDKASLYVYSHRLIYFFFSFCSLQVLFQEKDLHKYLEHIFNCLEHPIFDEETVIPRQLHRLFNRQHIEHLIPLAMSLGIDSDARYDEIVLQLDEDERNERLFNNEDTNDIAVSPLEKAAMKWAFGLPV